MKNRPNPKRREKPPKPANPAVAQTENPRRIRYVLLAAGGALLLFVVLMWLVLAQKGSAPRSEAELAALNRPHAAMVGNPQAKVTIVEFLDPACGTCREFYPLVKGILADNPGRIRLAIRLVGFHAGSDVAVRALEAAKRQDKFWPVLESLLA
jgi:protein-disulfide isomerase